MVSIKTDKIEEYTSFNIEDEFEEYSCEVYYD